MTSIDPFAISNTTMMTKVSNSCQMCGAVSNPLLKLPLLRKGYYYKGCGHDVLQYSRKDVGVVSVASLIKGPTLGIEKCR